MERLTKKVPGCFCYDLKDHKNVPGEFAIYDAFFDYNMAVKRLGEYEDLEEEGRLVEEENVLKFYYVRSIDEYWIGRRIDNFYYAEYDPKSRQWVWTHSRHLPWGEHVVSPTSLWKEHTYPSEPEEIPFAEWLQGFIKKHAADVVEVRHGRWLAKEYMCGDPDIGTEDMWIDRLAEQSDYYAYCSVCGKDAEYNAEGSLILSDYCPNCGAKMTEDHYEQKE